jgi:oligopeptidase B
LWGRSAGGLAVAAALNLDPSACGAAVLDVPFVDPLRTMLDPSLLLTVKERPEWGDPLHDEVRGGECAPGVVGALQGWSGDST